MFKNVEFNHKMFYHSKPNCLYIWN